MGKLRRQRKQLHLSSKHEHSQLDNLAKEPTTNVLPPLPLDPVSNVFSGITIDMDAVKKVLSQYDTRSVKSVKSLMSERGQNKIAKKGKIKLRRQLLLKKIDSINQMKKELKLREKRKNISIIGDTNPLHDALPSLNSLLASKPNITFKVPMGTSKRKGIDRANKRKKRHMEDINKFKSTLKSKNIKKNIFDIISNHINNTVKIEKQLKK